MGELSTIEWTNKTWNPWQGCTKVSPGCAHCYMFRDKTRYGQDPAHVIRSKDPTFFAPLKWNEPARVFTCSWSDFFHEAADPHRAEAWAIIRATPHLTYQILTKRTERILACLPPDWGTGYPNVWLGASFENQHWFDVRSAQLYAVPAVVRFGSFEPLLGAINPWNKLHRICPTCKGGGCTRVDCPGCPLTDRSPILGECQAPCPDCGGNGHTLLLHWAIVGGESGPGARPMHPEWVELIRDHCAEVGAAFFFKQWGEWVPEGSSPAFAPDTAITLAPDGRTWPAARGPYPPGKVTMHRVGKKAAGRRFEGREWNQFPDPSGAVLPVLEVLP